MAIDNNKAHYGQLANLAGFQEGDREWLYHPIQKRGKSPQVADVLRRPLPYHHLDQRCHIPYSATSQSKDDGHAHGKTGTLPGSYSGQVALRRGQCNTVPLPLLA
jgi:hypothetical protein